VIEPDNIPRIHGDLSALYRHGETLTAKGREFADTGADVHATWQGLGNFYRAPEAGILLTATAPVKTKAADLGSDFATIGSALMRYVDAVRPLQLRLWTLWDAAWSFRDKVAGDDDWRKDPGKLEEHNHLLFEVDQAVAAWEAAERDCANTINALFGGMRYVADNLDGKHHDNEYGLTATQFSIQADTLAGLPWGGSSEEDLPVSQDILNALHDFSEGFFVDGAEGDLKGLLSLVNPWHRAQFKRSWEGVAELGLLTTSNAPALVAINQHQKLLWIPQGQLAADRENLVKGLTAWDDWRDHPFRAAGHVTLNIVSLIAGPKGAGTITKAGELALDAERLAATTDRVAQAARDTLGRLPGFSRPWPTTAPSCPT
jgi:hypothetical protein